MACRMCEDKWQQLEKDTDRKKEGVVNLYQIVNEFVKPWTSNLGNSVALLLNNAKPLKAEVMFSHAWGEDMIEATVAVLSKMSVSAMSFSTVCWFCAYAQYQPGDQEGDCGPGVAAQLALDPFRVVIDSDPRFGMVVIHTSTAELYGRLWCVFEVNAAEDCKVVCSGAMSMNYFKEFMERQLTESPDDICKCHSQEAKCWSKEDEQMIKDKIEAGIGFEMLNKKILDFRKSACQAQVQAFQPLLDFCEGIFLRLCPGLESMSDTEKAEARNEFTFKLVLEGGFVPTVRSAGLYVAFHLLTTTAKEHADSDFLARVMRMLRDEAVITHEGKCIITSMCCNDEEGNDMGDLPGFDPRKRKPDSLLIKLMEDDELLISCLKDLSDFQHPIGWLELGAGSNIAAKIADEINFTAADKTTKSKLEEAKELFKRFDSDGDGTVSADELTRILQASIPGLSKHDCDLIMLDADSNKDGKIDFDEFIDWLSGSSLRG
eukprot:TRINITY_DN50960_c0_g1_i1.p1 TRINITY_DN50960_c0_g1~~TRINITY_DN50960_c0_g1_i1.p1  ORF type:complete len:530 (-),score=108.96 TRINITY_DN50960_c0_g1_i1:39-1505(-)